MKSSNTTERAFFTAEENAEFKIKAEAIAQQLAGMTFDELKAYAICTKIKMDKLESELCDITTHHAVNQTWVMLCVKSFNSLATAINETLHTDIAQPLDCPGLDENLQTMLLTMQSIFNADERFQHINGKP